MTLGQFAAAVGATTRWVQNARAALGSSGDYTEPEARRLGLAREIRQAIGAPLAESWRLAGEALTAWPSQRRWVHDAGPSVQLVVDLERYLSSYAVRLSLARTLYAERRRGRLPRRPRHPVEAARRHGVDVDLLRENLRREPAERLRRLDEDAEFVRRLEVVRP